MTALVDRDYFTDHSILLDPYAFFEAVREKGPVHWVEHGGYYMVTGFAEVLDVLKRNGDFSAANCVQGAATPLPFVPEGSDIDDQIKAHHHEFYGAETLITMDDREHSMRRALLQKLFVPSRLKANEEFITDYSDELVREATGRGGCELIKEIATPFVTLVIADLLGVPPADRNYFMEVIEAAPPPGSLDGDRGDAEMQPLVIMGRYFAPYIMARRAEPQDDLLSELANLTYPDGSLPELQDIVSAATFLFGAGQDTSAKLLGNSMKVIAQEPELQKMLREDLNLVPLFIEEMLRLEGSTKMTSRLARRDTRIGDVDIPAGTRIMLSLAAANRDPSRWPKPTEIELDRPKIKEHVAFGRGAHVCAGAPLARVEVRVILEKFLSLTSHIGLDEEKHGPIGNHRLSYEPSFIIRGLAELHLTLTPAAS